MAGMSDWIRDQVNKHKVTFGGNAAPVAPAAPQVQAPRTPGNAGAGTGEPPPSPPPTMNELIRRAAGRNY